MSTSYRLCFAVGVPILSLIDGPSYEHTVSRTVYDRDTGAPSQVHDKTPFVKLTNGSEVEGSSWYGYLGLSKLLGARGIRVIGNNDMAYGIAGMSLTDGEWDANASHTAELPSIKAEDAQRAYDLLTKAGFPIAQSDIKVYAVLDVSY